MLSYSASHNVCMRKSKILVPREEKSELFNNQINKINLEQQGKSK